MESYSVATPFGTSLKNTGKGNSSQWADFEQYTWSYIWFRRRNDQLSDCSDSWTVANGLGKLVRLLGKKLWIDLYKCVKDVKMLCPM